MNAVNSPPALRLEAQGPGEASPIRDDRLLEGALVRVGGTDAPRPSLSLAASAANGAT